MLNPVLKILLTGVYDPGSPLSNLRGCPHIVRAIWNEVKAYWESLIQFPNDQEESDDGNEFSVPFKKRKTTFDD